MRTCVSSQTHWRREREEKSQTRNHHFVSHVKRLMLKDFVQEGISDWHYNIIVGQTISLFCGELTMEMVP